MSRGLCTFLSLLSLFLAAPQAIASSKASASKRGLPQAMSCPVSMSPKELWELAMVPTPVEKAEKKAGKLYFRRGDNFRLAHILPEAAGDKLRQVLLLLLSQRERIEAEHNGMVATYTGVHSPQGVFVATAAKALNLNVLVGFGGDTLEKSLKAHPLLRICKDLGCDLRVVGSRGYESVLMSGLKAYFQEAGIKPQIVRCGMVDCDEKMAALKPIEDFLDRQVKALPRDLDNLIIPAGTGSSSGMIIRALMRNNIKPKRVIVVQNANYDRRDTINKILGGQSYPYEYHMQNRYPYEKWIKKEVVTESGEKIVLDGMVEAKAYEWMMENIDLKKEKTLFWIIAETVDLRGLREP